MREIYGHRGMLEGDGTSSGFMLLLDGGPQIPSGAQGERKGRDALSPIFVSHDSSPLTSHLITAAWWLEQNLDATMKVALCDGERTGENREQTHCVCGSLETPRPSASTLVLVSWMDLVLPFFLVLFLFMEEPCPATG